MITRVGSTGNCQDLRVPFKTQVRVLRILDIVYDGLSAEILVIQRKELKSYSCGSNIPGKAAATC